MNLSRELLRIQKLKGHLGDEELKDLSTRSNIPLARIEEVASSFPHFHRVPPTQYEVQVCRDLVCHHRGSADLITDLEKVAAELVPPIVAVHGVSCLGRCDRAPAILINHSFGCDGYDLRLMSSINKVSDVQRDGKNLVLMAMVGQLLHFRIFDRDGKMVVDTDEQKLTAKAKQIEDLKVRLNKLWPPHQLSKGEKGWILDDVTSIVGHAHSLFVGRTPENLAETVRRLNRGTTSPPDDDKSNPGVKFSSWTIDIYDNGPQDFRVAREVARRSDVKWVLGELEEAGLQGMGGPGLPTHGKWRDVYKARGDRKYVVCNGDESEPGTFKDREILLRKAHLVVEGIAIGALTVGASEGYVYIRDEYPEQRAAVQVAIDAFDRSGAAPGVKIEVFRSPGGYICGEQTALIEAMEGHRAEPRNRPPQLETNGLRDRPTLLNNVETLAWVPSILSRGGAWYRGAGANGHKGRRMFSISGDVARPGVYEVPVGLTVRELIKHAGGMRDGLEMKAFAPSSRWAGAMCESSAPACQRTPRTSTCSISNSMLTRCGTSG
jgi:NADH:ubiquinone oxidoreductase subunit E